MKGKSRFVYLETLFINLFIEACAIKHYSFETELQISFREAITAIEKTGIKFPLKLMKFV